MLSAAAAVISITDWPRIVMWHSQRRQTNCTTLLIDTRRGGGGVRLLLYRVQTYRLWRPNAMIQDLHAVIKSDWNATKAASSRPKRWQIDEGHEILSRSCGITATYTPVTGGFQEICTRSHQRWQWVSGSRVTGQVGQQIRVGHVGHGSVLVTRWPMIKLTRFQKQANERVRN